MSSKSSMKKGVAAVFGKSVISAAAVTEHGSSAQPILAVKEAKTPRSRKASVQETDASKKVGEKTLKQKQAQEQLSVSPASKPKKKKRPGEAPEGKVKVTYYLDQELVTKIRHLAVDLRKRDSVVIAECIQKGIEVVSKKASKKKA